LLHDRYPGWNVLSQRDHWDEATRQVVLDRVQNVPPFRHLDHHQRRTLEAICDRVIPQAHRPPTKRVPIAPWIDRNMANRVLNGFRFEDMPANDDAWYWGLQGVDETAKELFGSEFVDLDGAQQDAVLQAIRVGEPPGSIWQRLPAKRWWIHVALRQICGVYYAHPYAWDEIGFGGPAYPRGYAALNHGAPEWWEPREVSPEGGEVAS